MHKLQIVLERTQIVEIHRLFISATKKMHDENRMSFGTWQLCHEVSKKIAIRETKWIYLMELGERTALTYPVWHWEMLLLTIAKSGLPVDTYNQITVNEITEKIYLHMEKFSKFIHIP